uniref:sperm-egg fusion protein TMEM95-like n=1 Tax=Pristiophorus japonicus TaxID=55135 RepID=UPI00398F3D87
MCAPKCRFTATVINCTKCLEVEVNCWNMKKCWPNRLDLDQSIFLILGLSAASILIGFVTLFFESRRLQAKVDAEVE